MKTLDRIKELSLDCVPWQQGEDVTTVYLVSPKAIFVDMAGTLPDEAATSLHKGLRKFALADTDLLFWDVSRVDKFSNGIRDTSLDFMRAFYKQFREINVCSVSAPWTVKMGVNLASIITAGRLNNYSDLTSFVRRLAAAVDGS